MHGCCRQSAKKKKRGKKESWNVREFGGSGRDKKWKEVKKGKCKGTCVEEKNRGGKKGKKEEERNAVHVWRIKKEGKKNKKEMVSQYFHNIFTIFLQ